jgi:hypothetical protein
MTTATRGAVVVVEVPAARVNTKAARRRLVSYASLADLTKDLDKLEAAHRAGTLRRLGNHDAGANFAHLAMGMKGSFDGYPTSAPPWLRLLGRLMKKRVLGRPFQPGFNLRKDTESLAWDDSVSFEEGLRRLREQIARAGAKDARPTKPHPFFGEMTSADWQVYYLRHAELHLSFLQP